MHHKVIVVDARLVMTGSYNFSANAETRNDENLIMIHCRDIAARFIEEFETITRE
jgi:phosphatidylserine/phosphatidylglycerophosphate/cardiolipin synthase-like enzyme